MPATLSPGQEGTRRGGFKSVANLLPRSRAQDVLQLDIDLTGRPDSS